MFGKKKPAPAPAKPRDRGSLTQFGLLNPQEFGAASSARLPEPTEADLEAELALLMGADDGPSAPRSKGPARVAAKGKKDVGPEQLQAMVAACMQDIPSDDEVDEYDADLLCELQEIDDDGVAVQPEAAASCHDEGCAGQGLLSTIESRIRSYAEAEKNAKAAGENARARRFTRGLNTLNDQKRKVLSGKAVNDNDIPPELGKTTFSSAPKPAPEPAAREPSNEEPPPYSAPPAPIQPSAAITPQSVNPDIARIKQRREECKAVALEAKANGDKALAVAGLKAVKQCDSLLHQIGSEGRAVDLKTNLPPIPTAVLQMTQAASGPPPQRQFSRDDPIQLPANPEDIPPPDPALFGAPPAPTSVLEALEQRLQKYREDEAKAKAENNASRSRRLGRICKQYTDAIRMHRAGKPIPVNDLPTPPGFAPIPTDSAPTKADPQSAAAATTAAQPANKPPESNPEGTAAAAAAAKAARPAPAKKAMTARDKQIAVLEKRQAEFKAAALQAKKNGEVEQAKEYLRQYKGFDKMIEAAKSGLPVEMNSIPVPPQKQGAAPNMGFEIVSKEDCSRDYKRQMSADERQEMFSKLEKDLIAQIKMCDHNMKHFKRTGDIPSANKFQQMHEHTKKDLDALRNAFKRGDAVPRFHYEVRAFSRMICNSDLTDNDIEVTVVQGINYNVANPQEAHTYVKLEFPYPKETPFKDKTAVFKDSGSPEYNHKFLIPVNSKEKSYQRLFKRQSAKFEVWSKGGFLRGDSLLGTAAVKLQVLETKCTLHDSFALMDGRRAVGGKLEVKIRIRNPVLTKQVEKVEEKWLVVSFR